eukprot:6095689-Amphidinium_carterae.1
MQRLVVVGSRGVPRCQRLSVTSESRPVTRMSHSTAHCTDWIAKRTGFHVELPHASFCSTGQAADSSQRDTPSITEFISKLGDPPGCTRENSSEPKTLACLHHDVETAAATSLQ